LKKVEKVEGEKAGKGVSFLIPPLKGVRGMFMMSRKLMV
jgi:hypothetical protein